MTKDADEDKSYPAQRPISPIAICIIVLGGLNVLFGLTNLAEDLLTWRAWFADGILAHYERVRDLLFSWVPFRFADWFKDAFVIYSGFVFWAARVLTAGTSVEVRFGTMSRLEAIGAVAAGSFAGPVVLVQHLQRPRGFADSVVQIIANSGADTRGVPQIEAFARAYKAILQHSTRAMFWTALFMAAAFIAILFVATDLLDKWR